MCAAVSFFGRLRDGLRQTTRELVGRFQDVARQAEETGRSSRSLDVDTIEALEEILIGADVGMAAVERIVQAVRHVEPAGGRLRDAVRVEIGKIFDAAARPPAAGGRPRIVLVVGVNGTGKTTTVGKLAHLLKASGDVPLICAADTFRAAAVEQLAVWAMRANVSMVRTQPGGDPAAVVFDAIASAKARGCDVVVVDTAGRLHTRLNLMQELDKIRRVAAREVEGAPHEVLLVLDATVGQNGLAQAREFMQAAGVNGIVLSKLDGTAKGGVAVAIAQELNVPIRYVGVGEGIDDLVPFSATEYVDALFEEPW